MREPRPKQRFPGGGRDLYERLRRDYEPPVITVFPAPHVSKERAAEPATLTFEPGTDPMLYFWPVEGQWPVVMLHDRPADDVLERLAKAMRRDGAKCVTIIWDKKLTPGDPWKSDWQNWGDPNEFVRERYGDTALAVSGTGSREDRAGATAIAADHRAEPNGER